MDSSIQMCKASSGSNPQIYWRSNLKWPIKRAHSIHISFPNNFNHHRSELLLMLSSTDFKLLDAVIEVAGPWTPHAIPGLVFSALNSRPAAQTRSAGSGWQFTFWSKVFDSHKIRGQHLMLYPSQSSEHDEMGEGVSVE